jgi:AraC family transcriptional regulator of adaptative response/methylated-DNA-[protein]-cysteine methyltransferase
MSDYDRIVRVIRHLDEHHPEQPDLKALAAVVGLSVPHFHRLFYDWAGITPKDFLLSLTLTSAKKRLKEGNSVFDSALESGLSGPGRLHDLCVNVAVASPGEIKAGGRGWRIKAGVFESLFGNVLIAESPCGICHLSFFQPLELSKHWKALAGDWPHAELVRDDERAGELGREIFMEGRRPLRTDAQCSPLRLFIKGTPFQIKIWQALLQIPEGRCVSYGHLAGVVGNPKASRAVGTAVGKNPIGFLIPCHRVIRETGAIGGYRWGTVRKRVILAREDFMLNKKKGVRLDASVQTD